MSAAGAAWLRVHADVHPCRHWCRYVRAARLLDSLCIDTSVDVEARWLLGEFNALLSDWHPDMTACQLKRVVATQFLQYKVREEICSQDTVAKLYESYRQRRDLVCVVPLAARGCRA